MSCKYKYNNQWYTKEEVFNLLLKERNINSKGELIKPDTSTNYKWIVFSETSDEGDTAFKDPYRGFVAEFDTKEEADNFAKSQYPSDLHYVKRGNSKGISPKITNETLKESIDSVRDKIIVDYTNTKDLNTGNSLVFKDDGFENNKIGDIVTYKNNSYEIVGEEKESVEFPAQWLIKPIQKEYTEQALINTKIAKLKEIAKKYPRSLIRSEVKSISNYENYVRISGTDGLFDPDEMPFQKISSLLPSNGRVIDNPVKSTKLTKTSFKYISNPEINPYKFTPDKGGYSDVVSRLKSRLITLKITDKNMVIKDPNMFSRLQESWTNQAEKLYNLVSIPKVMIEDNGKVKFRDYLFNEIDYKNGVITESNKSSGDRIKLEEAGLSQQNINHFFNNYFNEPHTYSDGSSSESVNKEFNVPSYIEFINKRQRTNLDANSFNTIGEYINELNRLALESNDISIGLLSSEEVDKRACKR